MATLRTAVAAAARASSRRGSGFACPCGGAGSGLAVVSSRGGAGSGLAVLSSRGGAGALQLVRGFSNRGKVPNGQLPFWSWENWRSSAQDFVDRVKTAEAVWKVAYATHSAVYLFFTSAAGYAIWYVDGSVGEERRRREIFERTAVSGHQEHVKHTLESIEKVQEKINKFWDKFLSYREDELQHRGTVTKAADHLKKKGYVVVSAADFEALDCKMSEMNEMLAKMTELKDKLLILIKSNEEHAAEPLNESVEKDLNGTRKKEHAALPLNKSNEKEFVGTLNKEQAALPLNKSNEKEFVGTLNKEQPAQPLKENNAEELDGTFKRKQSDSGTVQGPGDAQPAVSDRNALEKQSDSGTVQGPGDAQRAVSDRNALKKPGKNGTGDGGAGTGTGTV